MIDADGVGFDDLGYAPELDRVLVPSGETGRLNLIEPSSGKVESVDGFSRGASLRGGHTQGPTSSSAMGDLVAVVDRSARTLSVVDPMHRTIVTSIALGGAPDYVRFEPVRKELWVTEPDEERIEIFAYEAADHLLERAGAIDVAGGPESLVFDASRRRAYANLWRGVTVAIELDKRTQRGGFANGCEASRTLAIDEARSLLFVACSDGRVSSIDLSHGGQIIATFDYRAGLDALTYDAARGLLYAPSGAAGTMAALAIDNGGVPSLEFEVVTAKGATCATLDGDGDVWICDPAHGRLLFSPTPVTENGR